MAEGVVAIVSAGIKPLANLIIQQAKFLSGVGYQIELAQIELHLIRGFLKDADTRQQDEELVRICVGLIRDAAYDLDEVIESFALKVTSRKGDGTLKMFLKRVICICNEGVDRYNIGSELEDIMKKLAHLRLSLQSYNIRQISERESVASAFKKQRDRRLTYGHEVQTHIVGLTEKTDELVKELVREGKQHLVVSIWGMGGSGKTTLAKQVFHHTTVKRHFDYVAWICISQQFDGKDKLAEILIELTSPTTEKRNQISKMNKAQIARELCSVQQAKRCLVVIDDIWTQEAWESMKPGFPINEETESRILLTTRNKDVASLASEADHISQPLLLDEKQSWELFEKIAIPGCEDTGSDVYVKKKELGKKIIGHCSGLPLAINVVASLLSRQEEIEEWEGVLKNVNKYIMRGRNVLSSGKSVQEYGVSGVLALSYDDLPSHLKLCFLYLAQFPEDHEIPVERLIELWIAEGFIASTAELHSSSHSEETMEEVAYGCLIELVERSMVQVGQYGLTGNVKTCRIHDLMRDWCLQKAKEENFVDILNLSSGQTSRNAVIAKVRRLALYCNRNDKHEFDWRDERYEHIRSLLYFVQEKSSFFSPNLKKNGIESLFNHLSFLRVLKVEHVGFIGGLPKTIGKLIHLRFLSLKDSSGLNDLPSSLSNLVLLQTLDLRCRGVVKRRNGFGMMENLLRVYGSVKMRNVFGMMENLLREYGSVKMRNVFGKMEQLRHLYLPGSYTLSGQKLSFAKLHNLQTLVNVDLETCDLNGFVHLTNLKKLHISPSFSLRDSSLLEELKNVLTSRSVAYEHLRSLSIQTDRAEYNIPSDILIRFPRLYKMRLEGKITELPGELSQNLMVINLYCTELKGDQIEILEKLPKLRSLALRRGSIESETLVFSQRGFPHLESLTLQALVDLKEWRVEKEAMPRLHRLNIEYCDRLQAIPDGLEDVTSLKELTIKYMPSRFCERVEEGGEDFYKIKHAPSLIITDIREDKEEETEEWEDAADEFPADES